MLREDPNDFTEELEEFLQERLRKDGRGEELTKLKEDLEREKAEAAARAASVAHNTRGMLSLNFIWAQFCAANVKNNGIDKSLFITHSKTMHMAIFSILMHAFLAYGMNLRFDLHGNPPTYPFHGMVFFGNTAVASLASIFFPDSIRSVLYALCVLISAGEFLYWVYQREEDVFMRHIRRFFNTLWMWSFGYFTEQRDILPRFIIN